MARISGIDLPRDKRIEVALTYIYGIGRVNVLADDIARDSMHSPHIYACFPHSAEPMQAHSSV